MAGRIILGIANPALDSNGKVDSGATLTFYLNNTTTLQSIYADAGLTTPLTNPLSPDSAGRFPIIWGPESQSYSVKWTPSGASAITYSNIVPVAGVVPGSSVKLSSYSTLAAADGAAVAASAELVIDTNVSLAANTTLSSKIVRFAGGVITRSTFTLTFNGVVEAGDIQIFDAAGTGLITMQNGIINAAWFGAKADSGATDNANPFLQCQKSQNAGFTDNLASQGRLPGARPFGAYYATSQPIPFYGSIIGDGDQITTIKPRAGYSAAGLLDFNYGNSGRQLIGVTLDVSNLGSSYAGSPFYSTSQYGGGGGSPGYIHDVSLISASLTVAALQAVSTGGEESGMLTGWEIGELVLVGPYLINMGSNQDDWRANVIRAFQAAGATTAPIQFAGTNWKVDSLYYAPTPMASGHADGTALIVLGNSGRISGLFVENGTTDATWLLTTAAGANACPRIDYLQTNMQAYSGTDADAALVRLTVPASAAEGNGISLGSYHATSGTKPYATLFSLFCGTVSTNFGPVFIHMDGLGWEQWTGAGSFAKAGTGGTSNTGDVWQFRGFFSGVQGAYQAQAPVAGNSPTWAYITPPSSWQNQ